jgi:hypothetical protein
MNTKLIPIAGAIAGSLLWATTAGAATVTIGASVNGGPITTEATGSGAASANFTIGGYTVDLVNGAQGALSDIFNSSSLNVSTAGTPPGTLDIFVTLSGLTSPTGLTGLESTLTSNQLVGGWTESLQTWLDPTNTIFGLGTQLAAHGFTGPGAFDMVTFEPLTGTYSLTELYIISAGGSGTANANIDISQTPLPATLPLLATGLFGLWGWSRKRKASEDLAEVSQA